jgi:hypothetical protein
LVARWRAAVSEPKTPAATVQGASSATGGSATGAGIGGGSSSAPGASVPAAGFGGVGACAGDGRAPPDFGSAAFAAASRASSRALSASAPVSLVAAAEKALAASLQRPSSTASAPCFASARPATTGSWLRAASANASRASPGRESSIDAHPIR